MADNFRTSTARIGRLLDELRRRKVFQTAGVYLVFSFVSMQVVDAVFQYLPFRDPDAAGRIVLLLLAGGFPVALVLSWLLDIAPPQLRREQPRTELLAEETADRDLRPDSVAVLPFKGLSDSPDDLYFSDGITGDIISAIAQIRDLRVLSRTSVMRFRDSEASLSEIAAELNAATIIEGSVRRSGSRVRILAEMIDARTDDHLWSQVYDREVEDLFEVQSDVAAQVARAVRRELSLDARASIQLRGTEDREAYDDYLRGRYLWSERGETAVDESIRFYERAIERDPDFALAHIGLAEALTVLALYGARAPREVLPNAREAAARALAIDPTLGEAMTVEACVTAIFDWRWQDATIGFSDALVLAPSHATARQWNATNVLIPQGRFGAAKDELEGASALDPGSAAIFASRGILSFYQRAYEEALAIFDEAVDRYPRFALAHGFRGECLFHLGDTERALASLADSVSLSGESSEALAQQGQVLAAVGRSSEAEAALGRLERRAERRYVSPALEAQVLVGLGRMESALRRLEEAAELRATDLIWLAVRPAYDPLRGESSFEALRTKLGLEEARARR